MKTVEKRLLEFVILGSLMIVAWSLPTLSKPTLAAPPLQTAEGVCAEEYVVVVDDWLSKLADKYFSDLQLYPAIVTATNQKHAADNTFALIENPDVIEPGWKLCIVEATAAADMAHAEEPVASEHAKPHWGYEGEAGPAAWGNLNPEYTLCSTGTSQSPIDITSATSQDLTDISFNYQPTNLNILNNGHTIQVNYDAGSFIELDGVPYELKQFHFHTPSEHTLNGEPFAMEMHLVHQSTDGTLAVVGVMIRQGQEHPAFQPVWANLPLEEGPEQKVSQQLNINDLLPAERLTYRYSGSLTTPPCSEGVNWLVLTAPIEMSEAQLAAFKSIFKLNNRPIQPLNERQLLLDSSADQP
jgi:carbonic anhydrase